MTRFPLRIGIALALLTAALSLPAAPARADTQGNPCDLYTGKCQPNLPCNVLAFTPSGPSKLNGLWGVYYGAWIRCDRSGEIVVTAEAIRDGTTPCVTAGNVREFAFCPYFTTTKRASGNGYYTDVYINEWRGCDPLQTRKWRTIGTYMFKYGNDKANFVEWSSTASPWINCPLN